MISTVQATEVETTCKHGFQQFLRFEVEILGVQQNCD